MEEGQGYFDVRFIAKKGLVQAVLMGGHFRSDERPVAVEIVSDDVRRSVIDLASPLFLVPDAVVKMAYETGKGDAPLKMSPCRSGPRKKPCGKCEECERARDEYFNHMLLHAVDFCGDRFAEKVKEAVLSVLGGSVVSVPWNGPMKEEEILGLFNAMRHEKSERNRNGRETREPV